MPRYVLEPPTETPTRKLMPEPHDSGSDALSRYGARLQFEATRSGTPFMPAVRNEDASSLRHGAGQVETKLFRKLADEWLEATGHLSLESNMVGHRAYLRIIGMGRDTVTPLILKELRARSGFWYRALEALHGANAPAIPREDMGNIRKMKAAWLLWGKEQGYAS